MFTPWLKRSALKRKTDKRGLLVAGPGRQNFIFMMTLVGIFLVLGIFVMAKSYAAGTYLAP